MNICHTIASCFCTNDRPTIGVGIDHVTASLRHLGAKKKATPPPRPHRTRGGPLGRVGGQSNKNPFSPFFLTTHDALVLIFEATSNTRQIPTVCSPQGGTLP